MYGWHAEALNLAKTVCPVVHRSRGVTGQTLFSELQLTYFGRFRRRVVEAN